MKYNINIDKRLEIPNDLANKHWELPAYALFQGEVNDTNAEKFINEFLSAEHSAKKAGQDILPIIINSPGGLVYACMAMIDVIKNCSLKVATIGRGKIASAGTILFSCGDEGHRYLSPNATVMIHELSLGKKGNIEEIKVSAKEGERLNKEIFKILDKNCGHDEGYFFKKLKDRRNSDWYMDAKEAKKHNITNHIKIPSFNININMEVNFE